MSSRQAMQLPCAAYTSTQQCAHLGAEVAARLVQPLQASVLVGVHIGGDLQVKLACRGIQVSGCRLSWKCYMQLHLQRQPNQ